MTEHPILFKGDMVRAILADSKTQTRRIIKPQPDEDGLAFNTNLKKWQDTSGRGYRCPYGEKGHTLWVRETWMPHTEDGQPIGSYIYRATDKPEPDGDRPLKWKPSIFMPRYTSRITLEVESVRVERIQDISDLGIRKEGIGPFFTEDIGEYSKELHDVWRELWDSINAKRGYPWNSNPWLWVVTFRRIK